MIHDAALRQPATAAVSEAAGKTVSWPNTSAAPTRSVMPNGRATRAIGGGQPWCKSEDAKKGTASQFPFGEALILKLIGEAEMGGSPPFSPEHQPGPGSLINSPIAV